MPLSLIVGEYQWPIYQYMISLITHTSPITLFPLLQHIPIIMGIHKKIFFIIWFSSGSENVVRGLLNSPAVQVIDCIWILLISQLSSNLGWLILEILNVYCVTSYYKQVSCRFINVSNGYVTGVQRPKGYQNSTLHVDSTVILQCRNWNVDANRFLTNNNLTSQTFCTSWKGKTIAPNTNIRMFQQLVKEGWIIPDT